MTVLATVQRPLSGVKVRSARRRKEPLPFAAVPYELSRDERLKPIDVKVVQTLLELARGRDAVSVTDDEIAGHGAVMRTGRTVRACLARLVDAGWLVVERGGSWRRVLVLRWRREAPETPVEPPGTRQEISGYADDSFQTPTVPPHPPVVRDERNEDEPSSSPLSSEPQEEEAALAEAVAKAFEVYGEDAPVKARVQTAEKMGYPKPWISEALNQTATKRYGLGYFFGILKNFRREGGPVAVKVQKSPPAPPVAATNPKTADPDDSEAPLTPDEIAYMRGQAAGRGPVARMFASRLTKLGLELT